MIFLRYSNFLLHMKQCTLFLSALLISAMTFAAKTTAIVTAGANASYTSGEALTVTGLSAEEVGYNESLTLVVYGWDGTGGAATGYAAQLLLAGEETAFCDEGLMVSKNQEDVITITGKMLGYPYDYQLDVQVSPKKASTIQVVSNNMVVEPDEWEAEDLKLTASAGGYTIEISLIGGMTKLYGTYSASALYATVNLSTVELVENTNAAFSLENDLAKAKFEASFVYGIDTLALTLTGKPYVDPADIEPIDYVTSVITSAYIGKMTGLNTVSGQNEDIEVKIQVRSGDWTTGVNQDDFSYGSYIKVAGTKMKILRGELKVTQTGDVKTATIGILCDDYVWYDITATTATELSTALESVEITTAPLKTIKNGQLIIIQNGVKYNAAGVVIQ
jgi:hypothetical protein